MTHRDRLCSSSGRKNAAGDAVHRQGFSTPSDELHKRPERRLAKAFGRRRARLVMLGITVPHGSWPKALASRLYESLSMLLGMRCR